MIKKLLGFKGTKPLNIDPSAIVPREAHTISRQNISENALKVLYRLHKAGYQAFLVGGGVRDLLLSHIPKDFDVATNATPTQIKKVFKNCRLIGRRFRLAHIHFGREIIEVATFRGAEGTQKCERTGAIRRDNTYGTLQEDAFRRDITINALYYNIADFSIIDLTAGMDDINQRVIRMIGDPETRYIEDPVRLIRVIRLAAKLDFSIASETASPIKKLAPSLRDVSHARLFEEALKLFHTGHAKKTFDQLREYHLFQHLFPITENFIKKEKPCLSFIHHALHSTDQRILSGKTVTPAFLYAVFLWYPFMATFEEQRMLELTPLQARLKAMQHVLNAQHKHTALPKRYNTAVRDIWHLQHKFTNPSLRRPANLLTQPRFRAAYDFLLLRAMIEPTYQKLADWWTTFQTAHHKKQIHMAKGYKDLF